MLYIVVTGGVISGLGKGITASSIGLLLKAQGFNVTAIKIDPYLNFDSGLMSPYQHGECYVLDDGGETDLDLGNYERFLNVNLTSDHSLTSGKVFKTIYDKERNGDYLGQTVQLVPHVTDFIQDYIRTTAKIPVDNDIDPDVCIIELGGTVGDYEGNIYYEALSEFGTKERCCFVHVSLVPIISGNEIKTKPTQHSIKMLRSLGISPDLLLLRCKRMLNDKEMSKVSKYCKMGIDNILINKDVNTIYEVPRLFMEQSMIPRLNDILGLKSLSDDTVPDLDDYYKILNHLDSNCSSIKIGIVGKYIGIQDTYLSLIRALEHASFKVGNKLSIDWIDSELSGEKLIKRIDNVNGVIIPGGFGMRGIEGMLETANYCRKKSIPLLGICLGMQIMCIEIDRHLFENKDATSEEFDIEKKHLYHTIVLSEEKTKMGATMRLGSYKCVLKKGSQAYKIYGNEVIHERHRHRYEINKQFVNRLQKSDHNIEISGMDESGRYPEIIENVNHNKFYVGCQFHPEYRSRHKTSHPLFIAFMNSCKEYK